MRTSLKVIGALMVTALMLSSTFAAADTWPPTEWKAGQEKNVLNGHSFSEEYFTTDVSNTSTDGTKYTFSASYVNYNNVQAFLVAFNKAEKDNKVSTLPYQFFGMHFYTPLGTEVFLGSVLAFLMAYNDTYDGNGTGQNGVMDPGNEPVYYIIPFGIGELPTFENDTSYAPSVEAIPAKKLGEGKYEFGMTYKNMYAKIIDGNSVWGFLLSAALPLYIAKFSELTIKYRITMDKASKTVTTETYYTLGQVHKLWFWGKEIEPDHLPSTFGISAVHFVTMFNSKYWSVDKAGNSIKKLSAGMTEPASEVQMRVGNQERAFDVGFRGKYDLIDETQNNKVISEDNDAMNIMLGARLNDLVLVAWQGKISIGLMALFAYALSEDIQGDFDGPWDLSQNAGTKFWGGAFWYAVAFPKWDGYRVEHDPVFTAHTSFEKGEKVEPGGNCSSIIMASVGMVGLAGYTGYVGHKRRKNKE